jgi:hypothetical protein
MAKINARQKGARGELEVAHLFTDMGYPAYRGIVQTQSSSRAPDVCVEKLPFLWVEVKRGSATAPLAALEQCDEALTSNKKYSCAVAFTRNDRDTWKVWMRGADAIKLNFEGFTSLPQTVVVCMTSDMFFNLLKKNYEPSEQQNLPLK